MTLDELAAIIWAMRDSRTATRAWRVTDCAEVGEVIAGSPTCGEGLEHPLGLHCAEAIVGQTKRPLPMLMSDARRRQGLMQIVMITPRGQKIR